MKTLEMVKATEPLADYAKNISKGPVILTVEGRPVAALVSIENADWETISLSTNSEFIDLIDQSRAMQKAEGGISSAQMRQRLSMK